MRKFSVTKDLNKDLQQLYWDRRLAVAISTEHARYVRNSKNLEFYCFNHPNKIHEYSTKYLLRHNFPFLKELNRFLKQASDGGLIAKWIKTCPHAAKKITNMKPFEDGSIIVELFIHNTAIIVAFIVLIIEKIVHKKVHTQGSGRFWSFIQTLIDSERYFLLNKVNIHLNREMV